MDKASKICLAFCYLWMLIALGAIILGELVTAFILIGIASIHGCLYEISKRIK